MSYQLLLKPIFNDKTLYFVLYFVAIWMRAYYIHCVNVMVKHYISSDWPGGTENKKAGKSRMPNTVTTSLDYSGLSLITGRISEVAAI